MRCILPRHFGVDTFWSLNPGGDRVRLTCEGGMLHSISINGCKFTLSKLAVSNVTRVGFNRGKCVRLSCGRSRVCDPAGLYQRPS